ncbi:MAG: Gfo/Idh/MocA family oxidoreductase, partial [candidate division Zixibacteria bacterium]|nr:Gfo/Idh/MocA family oxidoreductase [candidate division Zixibacteria bacterium]
ELGKVYYLYASRVNLGKVRNIENALWSFAPHDISIILYLLGKDPVRVTSTGSAYLQPGIEDVVFTTLHFGDGTMAHIHVSWLDPHKDRKLVVVGSKKMAMFDDSQASEKIRLYDKGVDTKQDYETYGEYLTTRTGDITIPQIRSSEPLADECRHFLECIEKRELPRSDGIEGLRVLKVLDAAQKSLEAGGAPVSL